MAKHYDIGTHKTVLVGPVMPNEDATSYKFPIIMKALFGSRDVVIVHHVDERWINTEPDAADKVKWTRAECVVDWKADGNTVIKIHSRDAWEAIMVCAMSQGDRLDADDPEHAAELLAPVQERPQIIRK